MAQLQQRHAAAAQSYEELRLSEAQSGDLLTVIDPAVAPLAPIEPRLSLNVLLGAFGGLIIAIGAALLTEHLDDRLTTGGRLKQIVGLDALASLALLPHATRTTVAQLATATVPTEKNGASPNGAASNAEVFRLLSTNLRPAGERSVRALITTSPNAGDGKTTTAVNLATATAESGRSVLLVDADLRSPTLHDVFGVSNEAGFSSLVMDDQLALSSVLVQTPVKGLTLLPSGPLPPDPSQLLASVQLRQRLSELIMQTDMTIFDCAPALAASDPALLSGLVDGTLLVVDAKRTRGADAVRAVTILQSAGANIIGVVLNRVHPNNALPYGYHAQRNYASGWLRRHRYTGLGALRRGLFRWLP